MSVRRILATIALASLVASGAGCVTIGRQYEGLELPAQKLAAVKVAATTRQEVLREFGAPTTIRRSDLEALVATVGTRYVGNELTIKIDPALLDDVYVYEYRRVNRTALLFGFFNYISSNEKSDRLMFFFDHTGKVAGWGLTQGTKEL